MPIQVEDDEHDEGPTLMTQNVLRPRRTTRKTNPSTQYDPRSTKSNVLEGIDSDDSDDSGSESTALFHPDPTPPPKLRKKSTPIPAVKRAGVRTRAPAPSKSRSTAKTKTKSTSKAKVAAPSDSDQQQVQPDPLTPGDDAATTEEENRLWFPEYTRVEKHVLWPHGAVLVYRNPEYSVEQLERRRVWASKAQVPDTLDPVELTRQGRIRLPRGDAVFCQVTNNPSDDIFKVANTPESLISDDLNAALQAMTKEVIGKPSECGPNIPVNADEAEGDGKKLEGGTAYERRLGRNIASSQGERCYQNAITCEVGANHIGPAANVKGKVDADIRQQGGWNQLIGGVHGKAVNMCISRDLNDTIKERLEAYNCPTYGPQHNIYHTSLQANFASPAPPGIQADLSQHLGVAGGAHTDEHDDPMVPTVMTCTSNLRKGVHPGLFHILDLGIYVELERNTTVVFSGRHRHGGTAPFVPEGMGQCDTDVRMTWISYPNQLTLDRCGPLLLASVGFKSESVDQQQSNTLFTPPQLDVGRLDAHDPVSEKSRSFASHGIHVMDAKTHQLLLKREMLNLEVAVMNQAGYPPDCSHLSESIGNYADGTPMPGLLYGPGGDPSLRKELERKILITRLRVASTVPLMLGARVQSRPVEGLPTVLHRSLAVRAHDVLGGPWSSTVTDESALSFLAELSKEAVEAPSKPADAAKESTAAKVASEAKEVTKSGKSAKSKDNKKKGTKKPALKKDTKKLIVGTSIVPTPCRTSNHATLRSTDVNTATQEGSTSAPAPATRGRTRTRLSTIPEHEGGPDDVGSQADVGHAEPPTTRSRRRKRTTDSDDDEAELDQPPPPKRAKTVPLLYKVFDLEKLKDCISQRADQAQWFTSNRHAKGLFQGQQKINNDTDLLDLAFQLHDTGELMTDNHIGVICGVWPSITRAIATAETMAFALRNIWQVIMLAVHRMYLFIRTVREDIPDALDTEADQVAEWLRKLVHVLDSGLNSKETGSKTLSKSHFTGVTTQDVDVKITWPREKVEKNSYVGYEPEAVANRQTWIQDIVCNTIVPTWFKFPNTIRTNTVHRGRASTTRDWVQQGRFVDYLIAATGGTDALLLDGVRDCFQAVRANVLGIGCRDVDKEADWDGVWDYLCHTFQSEGDKVGPVLAAVNEHAAICTETMPNPIVSNPSLSLNDDHLPKYCNNTTINRRIHAASSVAGFLKDLMPLIDKSRATIPPSRMVSYALGETITFPHEQYQIRHQDHHFPFREHAPSRSALKVIDNKRAWTHAGVFSFALCRATTLSTTFCRKYPYLDSWPSFLRAKRTVEEETEFSTQSDDMKAAITDIHLCSMNAYGRTPNMHRNIAQAESLWDGTAAWETLVKENGSEPVSWMKAMQWAKKTKPEIPQIKSMGLTGYLFLVDLAYAGVVVEPTVREVGLQVNAMGRGAYNCLAHFCLVPNTKRRSPVRELITLSSFTQLFEDVRVALGTEDATTMGFDPIILEHTLCKYMRFFNNNYLDISSPTMTKAVETLKTHFKVTESGDVGA